MQNHPSRKTRLLLTASLLFLAACSPAATALQPSPLPPTPPPASPTAPLPTSGGNYGGTFYEIQRVSLENARAAFDAGTAIFLDVRSPSYYATSHIPGAVNIPYSEIEARLGELDPERWIIPYCTWLSEHSSAGAARILLDHGFKKVNPILGGFDAWLQAGYPLEP